MRALIFTLPLTLLLSSCFVRTNRVFFERTASVNSTLPSFNADSILFHCYVRPGKRTLFIPFFEFRTNRSKAAISYSLSGHGISAREYSVAFRKLMIYEDSTLLARSIDSSLFTEKVQKPVPPRAISPLYGTKELMRLDDPRNKKLSVRLECVLINRQGARQEFILEGPMEKIREKAFSLPKVNK